MRERKPIKLKGQPRKVSELKVRRNQARAGTGA
jgi:hypothetical protein